MSTIRVQGIPQGATLEEISEVFGVERDHVSLALARGSNNSPQTATVTLENDIAVKKLLKKPLKIHEKIFLIDDHFLGLTVLSSGDNSTDVDIIAVHGLSGHGFKTWASGDRIWLRDFLPTQLPSSRIMTYGYNSDFRDSTEVSTIRSFAQRLLTSIDQQRTEEEKTRPIIFICHSLGGIIVKLALNIARVEERTRIVNDVTYGIIFLATPHQGSQTADYGAIVGLAAKALNIREDLVQSLRTDSSRLSEIADEFRQHHDILQISTFYETKKTKVKKGLLNILNEVVVDQRSAVLNLKHEHQTPLNRDHREICRFYHEEESDYKTLYKQIERMTEKAADAVGARLQARLQVKESQQTHHFMVPYAENEHFTGRKSVLSQLNQKLQRKSGHKRVALWGLGGSGKTQLALKYAYAQRKPGLSVFWVHASNYERFRQDYLKVSRLAQITGDRDSEGEILLKVKDWFESPESGEWILVIDNADDLLHFSPTGVSNTLVNSIQQTNLSKFIPEGSKGTIIITTRDYQVASRLANNSSINVVAMEPAEAKELFSRLGPECGSPQDQEVLSQLFVALDFLPLAIVHAAAYMRENFLSPSRYFKLFDATKAAQRDSLHAGLNDFRVDSNVPESVLTTYFITFEQIQTQNPLAANLLRLIAFFDRQGIPRTLLGSSSLEGVHDDALLDRAIGKILSLSLATQAIGGETYELHRLVHLSIQRSLSQEEYLEWRDRALGIMLQAFPDGEHENRDICASYLPHALLIIRNSKSPKTARLLLNVGWYLWRVGRYKDSGEHLSRCLHIREEEEGKDSSNTLAAVNLLALALQYQGKFAKAEGMYRRALEGHEKLLGPGHQNTLTSISNLGSTLMRQGKYQEAEEMTRQAVEGYEKLLGREHKSTLISTTSLALVLNHQGKYTKAEELCRWTVEGSEKVLGPEHPETLISIDTLATILQYQDKFEESEQMNRRALEGREKILGPEHPHTLTSIHNLALVLQCQGKHNEAEEMILRSLEGREKLLGPDNIETLSSVSNLALVLQGQRRHHEAEERNRHALEGYERLLGPEHPLTLTSVNNLATVLICQGKYDESIYTIRRALEGREKVLGPEHPETILSRETLKIFERNHPRERAINRTSLVLRGSENAASKPTDHLTTGFRNLTRQLFRTGGGHH